MRLTNKLATIILLSTSSCIPALGLSRAAIQREINTRAAALDTMRHQLLDGPNERSPGESVDKFLTTFVQMKPKETPTAYDVRVNRYVSITVARSRALAGLLIPSSGAGDPPYSATAWKEIRKLQTYLPQSANRLRAAMTVAQRTGKPLDAAPLVTLINLELAGYQALRDARPAVK